MKEPDQRFWERVKKAQKRILALDYDGTLAPFCVERMAGRPLPGTIEILEAILAEGSTSIAVVSGRPLSELEELLSTLSDSVLLIGAHGWEWRGRGGAKFLKPGLDDNLGARLEQAYSLALADDLSPPPKGVGGRVEKKAASVAVHVRGMKEDDAGDWLERVRRSWSALIDERLELMEFNGGMELRARGRDKGIAVRELLALYPEAAIVVYIGDDATDEDAFRALPPAGVGIKVGGEPGSTAAHYLLVDSAAVGEFLSTWNHVIRGQS